MKIAIVGKGGSGKSSTSWLLSEFLSQKNQVLAIDADHNMDLAGIYGIEVDNKVNTLHRLHDQFRQEVGLLEDSKWYRIVTENDNPHTFSFLPKDNYTQLISNPIKKNLDLAIVGLGADDIMFSDRCAHGHSAPLKFYLALLEEGEGMIVVDGVAGADMVNFGLYNGVDILLGVVEPHINSVKVFRQLKELAKIQNIPLYGVVNKPRQNDLYKKIYEEFGDIILGEIGYDEAIIDYDFTRVSEKTVNSLDNLWSSIARVYRKEDTLDRLRQFEFKKLENKLTK